MQPKTADESLLYDEMQADTGITILYAPQPDGGATLEAARENAKHDTASFKADRLDEAHILYVEATELLRSRAAIGEREEEISPALATLFALFRGEQVAPERLAAVSPRREARAAPSKDFAPNPGKSLEIDVDGVRYMRLPVKTRLIDLRDTDILPLIQEYAAPSLQPGDTLYVSEKALTITQGRVVDMSTIHPGWLARLLARNVGNYYGTKDFHGFGHGTTLAMQLFIEEAGYPRTLFAAAVSAITRPLGIRGAFYYLCGKSAKSIDCPMSFLILEYAHSAKLAPKDSDGEARRIRAKLGCEVVILDANYRGAFSLGKSSSAITESFIGKLFRDNPLGQSDEMTPFCIVRKG